ncbi:MAG: iron-sulfur cluster assembly accessory protein [Myxococcota bacterium]
MIKVTERAAAKALLLAAKEQKGKVLRVGVRGGGCSGLSYFLDFDDRRDDDAVLQVGELTVVCDPKSLKYVDATELDYEASLLKGGFRFNNPLAKRSCSCGESFAV